MQYTTLGRTQLRVSRTAFGALPIQRVSFDEAKLLLRKAYDHGVNFFDTARAYTDSEEKIGYALADVREKIIIATKTSASTADDLFKHLETSLRNLRTDHVDILQLHNPPTLAGPEHGDLYSAMLKAREKGMVRFIGITNHRLDIARQAAASGWYDTVQFPLSAISSDDDLVLIDDCRKHNIGLIAMKGLCGGLLTNAAQAFAFLRQYENVVPIWGVQREYELDEFLTLEDNPPVLDDAMWQAIQRDREELAGDFCRACGYCLPCPANIPIPTAARMTLMMRRAPYQQFLSPEWQEQMALIEKCKHCGNCAKRCPYGLDTPRLLQDMLKGYREMVQNLV
ncbi:MAG TPA: aldo/keto reductase [Armatimonadota bacterium]|nr:aldo/keto reductase [Armatimonadota bacterium]